MRKLTTLFDFQDHTQGFQDHTQGFQDHTRGFQDHTQGFQDHAQGFQDHTQGFQDHAQGFQDHKGGRDRSKIGPVAGTCLKLDEAMLKLYGAYTEHTGKKNTVKSRILALGL